MEVVHSRRIYICGMLPGHLPLTMLLSPEVIAELENLRRLKDNGILADKAWIKADPPDVGPDWSDEEDLDSDDSDEEEDLRPPAADIGRSAHPVGLPKS